MVYEILEHNDILEQVESPEGKVLYRHKMIFDILEKADVLERVESPEGKVLYRIKQTETTKEILDRLDRLEQRESPSYYHPRREGTSQGEIRRAQQDVEDALLGDFGRQVFDSVIAATYKNMKEDEYDKKEDEYDNFVLSFYCDYKLMETKAYDTKYEAEQASQARMGNPSEHEVFYNQSTLHAVDKEGKRTVLWGERFLEELKAKEEEEKNGVSFLVFLIGETFPLTNLCQREHTILRIKLNRQPKPGLIIRQRADIGDMPRLMEWIKKESARN